MALGVSLLLLFSTAGLTLSPVTIIVGHVTFCIAYVAFVVRARLETLRPDVEEAARDLGATLFGVVRLVILPQIAPAAIVAFALAFLLSFDDFVVSFFASGVDISPLPVYIYGMLRLGVTPEINAIGTIMIAAALLLGVIGFVVALRRGIVKQMTGAAQGD
ncbi:ABC transporter permease [Leucobacter soli]|uniref:ABC transporter permease n=1 Tax=Leucobacter soli TaxID=2812850 RepID=UPI003605B4CE